MRVGVDMGGTSVKIGLVDEKNRIIVRSGLPTETDIPYQAFIQKIGLAVLGLLHTQNMELSDCEGIGIGSPGTIDMEEGVILYSNNFGWENVAFVDELQKTLDIAVKIANDADAAALGEVCAGAAKGVKNAVLLTLGTGVGSGVILNGEIFRGPLRGGCELGHMVIAADGAACTCGRRGCLEAYASATALIRIAVKEAEKNADSLLRELCKGDLSRMDGRIVFQAAEKEDEAAQKAVEVYEHYLACGIANIVNIFRPEKIILGGGIAGQRGKLTEPLTMMVNTMVFGGSHGQMPELVVSELGNDAGIIGAANL